MEAEDTDPLVAETESMLDQHEMADVPEEGPMPGNKMTDDAVMAEIKKLMSMPGMDHLCGMIIINWHIYAVIRQEMEAITKGKLVPEVFAALLQGLQVTAMEPFSIEDLKRDMKKKLSPWIREVCNERVTNNRKGKHGSTETTEDDA